MDQMVTTALAALAAFESADISVSAGHKMESGYGGDGKSVEPHSYAAMVTAAIWGPKYNKNVCSPIGERRKNNLIGGAIFDPIFFQYSQYLE